MSKKEDEFEQNADTFEVISIDNDKYDTRYQDEQIEKCLNKTKTQSENVFHQLHAEVEWLKRDVQSNKDAKIQSNGSLVAGSKFDFEKLTKQRNLKKLGLLLSRFWIFTISFILFVTIGQVVTYVVLGVFDLFLLISSVLSFGFIYAAYQNFAKIIMSIINNTSEIVASISNVMEKMAPYFPVAIAVMILSGVFSIVLLGKVEPRNYKTIKVTLIMIMSIVSLIAIVAMIAVGCAKWRHWI